MIIKNSWSDKEVEEHWDKVASIYVEENNKVKRVHDQRFVESIKKLKIFQGCRILNISSRDGEANDYLIKVEKNIDVINAEISNGLIRIAAQARPYIHQVKIETYSKLPFENQSFDNILTLETLEHVAKPLKYLQELCRVAKNNAVLVLSCPPNTAELSYRIYTLIFGGHGEGPHRFLHPNEVKSMLKLSGWHLIEHYGTLLIPVGSVWLQEIGEKLINRFSNTPIANYGIRQYYICIKNER
jgi:2-polyprenyl-3-methyl-5-hydroxy-6-metoxy-1,4-benzoquinol methylase